MTDETGFWIRRDDRRGPVVLRAGGELDALTAGRFAEQLQATEDALAPSAPLLLDLTELTYLSSAAITTLVIHAKRCAERNTRLRVVAGHPGVLRPIELTGADDVIDVVATLEDALGAE